MFKYSNKRLEISGNITLDYLSIFDTAGNCLVDVGMIEDGFDYTYTGNSTLIVVMKKQGGVVKVIKLDFHTESIFYFN